jgi:hypothetical protein
MVLVAGVAMLTSVGVARATHDEPGKGRSVKMPLVTAYQPCTQPNDFTAGANPLPACSPPVRNDINCGFQLPDQMHGAGKASAISQTNGDIELKITAKGLLCEGYQLCGTLSFRATTDRCQNGPACTVVDIIDWTAPLGGTGCCVVSGGMCRIKTTVNAIRFDTINQGDRAGVELMGCGLKRMTGPQPPSAPSFRCGPLAGPLTP